MCDTRPTYCLGSAMMKEDCIIFTGTCMLNFNFRKRAPGFRIQELRIHTRRIDTVD